MLPGDRPDTAPGDPHQLDHRGFRAVRDEPGDLIVEGPGVPSALAGPRHRSHRHPMLRVAHTWRLGLNEHPQRAGIKRSPPSPPLTVVVAAAPPPTAATATTRAAAKRARHHDLVAVLSSNSTPSITTPRSTPSTRAHTLFDCTPFAPSCLSSPEQPESQVGQRGAPADGQLPTDGKRTESHFSALSSTRSTRPPYASRWATMRTTIPPRSIAPNAQ